MERQSSAKICCLGPIHMKKIIIKKKTIGLLAKKRRNHCPLKNMIQREDLIQ